MDGRADLRSPTVNGGFYGLSPVFTVGTCPDQDRIDPVHATRPGGRLCPWRDDPWSGYGFNEPVDVTQAQRTRRTVWLTVGNEVRRAWYASGSGTANLEFTYTVQSRDLDSDGVSLCSDTSLHGLCRTHLAQRAEPSRHTSPTTRRWR